MKQRARRDGRQDHHCRHRSPSGMKYHMMSLQAGAARRTEHWHSRRFRCGHDRPRRAPSGWSGVRAGAARGSASGKKSTSRRAGPAGRRRRTQGLAKAAAERLDPKRLVFIDETSVSTTITRLYGRAPQGERLVQKVPHGNWKTITFIAALRHDRITAAFVLEGERSNVETKAFSDQVHGIPPRQPTIGLRRCARADGRHDSDARVPIADLCLRSISAVSASAVFAKCR